MGVPQRQTYTLSGWKESARNSTDPYPVLENSSARALIKCVLPQEGQVIGGVTRWLKAEGFSMVLANVLVTQSLLATFSPLILASVSFRLQPG
jgi:hypothetical protein